LCDHYCSEKLINNQYNQLFLIQKYAFSAVSDLNRHKPNAYALNRFPGLERLEENWQNWGHPIFIFIGTFIHLLGTVKFSY
jgi:hypothetical protein